MEKKIEKLRQEAAKLEKIKSKFPDVTETRDRWGTVRLSAKSANSLTTDIETRHSCGCCNDAPYYAQPYLTFEGERIYSNPERICIGEKATSFYGDIWYENWRDKLAEIGVPEDTINKLEPSYQKDKKRFDAYNDYQEDLSEID